jgi:integrase
MNVSRGRVYAKALGGKKKARRTVWFLDYSVDGRRIRKATRAGSKTEAEALLRATTADIDRMRAGLPPLREERLRDAVKEYIKLKKAQGRRSLADIEISIGHVEAHLGDLFISRIDVTHLEDYRAKRRDEVAAMATINREMAALKNLYHEWSRAKKYLGRNPVEDLVFYPEPPRQHYILSADEYGRLIEGADPRLRPIIQVALRTGLRKDDLLGLRWKDVDLERRILTAWISKTGKWHTLKIGDDLAGIFEAIARIGEYIFTNPETGTRWNDIKKWWMAAKTKAGLGDADLTFHDLRANAGTRTAEKAGGHAAQMLLGHKSATTTARYLGLSAESAEAAAKALDDFYGPAPDDSAPARHQN